ncbi:MAG: hypothetical protein QOF23_634 [Solirubrobacterales bacterium]|nr:hypothetical protein [Solirubrobacterales bacterium]
MTDQTDTIDQELEEHDAAVDEEEWQALDREELPPRPRNRFLRPLPIGLLALLIAALGFLGGVEVQKASGEGASASSPFGGGGLAALQGAPFAAAASGAGAGGQGESVTGTVTGVNGKTIYVKASEGTVHAVRAAAGATVTRTAKAEAKGIHPGDSVVVEGTQNGSKVTATSIRPTAGGAEPAGPGGGAGGGESSGGEEGGVASLFAE